MGGEEGAERGHWPGKGPVMSFPLKAIVPKSTSLFTWSNQKFTQENAPSARKEVSSRKILGSVNFEAGARGTSSPGGFSTAQLSLPEREAGQV